MIGQNIIVVIIIIIIIIIIITRLAKTHHHHPHHGAIIIIMSISSILNPKGNTHILRPGTLKKRSNSTALNLVVASLRTLKSPKPQA